MSLPLPPYAQLTDFLPGEELDLLLEWVLGHEDLFAPATIMSGDKAVVNAEWRVGLTCRDLGPLEPQLRKRMLDALPLVMAKTGATVPSHRPSSSNWRHMATGRTIGPIPTFRSAPGANCARSGTTGC